MHGFPLEISKKLTRNLINNLRPTDRFNVLLFAGSSTVLSEKSLPATKKNVEKAMDVIDHQRGGGGTELLPALKRALSMQGTKGYSRNILIAADGYVTVGKEAFNLIRNRLGNANIFAFGIGSSVNRYLIEGMARVGMGEPYIITRPEDASVKAEKFRKLIASPVLTHIKIDYGNFNVFDIEPPSIPDVLADRPVIVFGKYKGRPNGTIRLQGITGDETYMSQINVSTIKPLKSNSALRYLWARHRIAVLSDYNRLSSDDKHVKEVTNLGLTYNLLTAYTSFIAVDSQSRLYDGQATTVKQPLPLPHGVSDYAVARTFFAGANPCKKIEALSPNTFLTSEYSRLPGQVPFLLGENNKDKKMDAEPFQTPGNQIKEKLSHISVPTGMSKLAAKKLIEKQIHTINACHASSSEHELEGPQKVAVTLIVDSTGLVTGVHVDKNAEDRNLKQCIIKLFEKFHFSLSNKGGVIKVIFSLTTQS